MQRKEQLNATRIKALEKNLLQKKKEMEKIKDELSKIENASIKMHTEK